jgi:hypothetical protein
MKVTWRDQTGIYIGILLLIDASHCWVRIGERMHLISLTKILPVYSPQ